MKKQAKNQQASLRLKNLNTFFAVFGSFITAIFSIFQYFFGTSNLFDISACIAGLLILALTYFLCCSNKASKAKRFWKYLEICSEPIGIINPLVLVLSILLAVVNSFELMVICCGLLVCHIGIYIVAIDKCNSSINKNQQ